LVAKSQLLNVVCKESTTVKEKKSNIESHPLAARGGNIVFSSVSDRQMSPFAAGGKNNNIPRHHFCAFQRTKDIMNKIKS
jgi:hypothetical protein